MDHFLSLFNLLQYCFCFMFCFVDHKPCGILAARTGIEPAPPALEGKVLTTGTQGGPKPNCPGLLIRCQLPGLHCLGGSGLNPWCTVYLAVRTLCGWWGSFLCIPPAPSHPSMFIPIVETKKVGLTRAPNSHSIYPNPQVLKPRKMCQIVLNSKAHPLPYIS